jgi:hypothetical protein
MGFIIHKYFLSKSLSAPPPSDSKKNKKKGSKAQRRYSQPAGGGVASDYLTVPDGAYSGNAASAGYNTPRSRRRNSMSSAPSSSQFRRASMPAGGTAIIEEGGSGGTTMEDSMGSMGGGGGGGGGGGRGPGGMMMMGGRQKSFRRASLQTDSTYQREEQSYYQGQQDLQNSFSGYYQMEDTKEETAYAEWAATGDDDNNNTAQRRFPRRSSTGSAVSMESDAPSDADGSAAASSTYNQTQHHHPSIVQQENRWLQLQVKQMKRHCAQLESKLYGARDQLAYTNASWLDQLYDARTKHQQEVFQSQRQAEKASNAVLEEEFEELRNTLTRVAQEEAKLDEKKKEMNLHSSNSDGDEQQDHEEYDVKRVHAELVEWKERYAQATLNNKRIQDILEQEALDRNALLQESERRVNWLEDELKAAIPPMTEQDVDVSMGYQDTNTALPVNARHIALLHKHQSQLEERVQELLLENAQLQRGQAQSYELQNQVKELQDSLAESRKQQELHQNLHGRQVDYWKQATAKWQTRARQSEETFAHQVTSREAIRGEYATRIETLELENVNLKHELETKQKQWTHQSNLKERTIASLENDIDRLGGTPPPAMMPVAAEAPSTLERIVENMPVPPRENKPLDQTVATEDTVFNGASSSSSIPEGPIEKGHRGTTPASSDPSLKQAPVPVRDTWSLMAPVDDSEFIRAQQREKELLIQISRLTESEANAKNHAEQFKQQIAVLEGYLNQGEGSASSDEED